MLQGRDPELLHPVLVLYLARRTLAAEPCTSRRLAVRARSSFVLETVRKC
jgi:hypothetical protein